MVIDALGETVDQALTEFEDSGGAMKVFVFGAAQETGLHFGGKRAVSQSEFCLDGEPHGNIGGRHENHAADDSAGPFKNTLERNKDSAHTLTNTGQSESVTFDERDVGEQVCEFFFCDRDLHVDQLKLSRRVTGILQSWLWLLSNRDSLQLYAPLDDVIFAHVFEA